MTQFVLRLYSHKPHFLHANDFERLQENKVFVLPQSHLPRIIAMHDYSVLFRVAIGCYNYMDFLIFSAFQVCKLAAFIQYLL